MAEITFDPDMLECDYDFLAGHVAKHEIVAPGVVKVWSFHSGSSTINGAPCDPAINFATLKFTVKNGFSDSGVPTTITISNAQVNPPSILQEVPDTTIGPAIVINAK
jgi:hypothetical protein